MVLEEVFDEVEVVPDIGAFRVSGVNLCDAVNCLKHELPFPPGDERYSRFSVVPSEVDGRTVLSVNYAFSQVSCGSSNESGFADTNQMYSDLLLVLIVQKHRAGKPLHIEEAVHVDIVSSSNDKHTPVVSEIVEQYDADTRRWYFE